MRNETKKETKLNFKKILTSPFLGDPIQFCIQYYSITRQNFVGPHSIVTINESKHCH